MDEDKPILFDNDFETNEIISIMQRIKHGISLHNGQTLSFIPTSLDDVIGADNSSNALNRLCTKGLIKVRPNSKGIAGIAVEIMDESAFENYFNLIKKTKNNHQHEDKHIFWFDDFTFKLEDTNGDYKAINFSPSGSRGTNCYYFMKAIIALLKQKNIKDGIWLKANFTRGDIINMVSKLSEKRFDTNWVDDTKGNWKKIIPKDWDGYIELSNFNRSSKGYELKLKMPE